MSGLPAVSVVVPTQGRPDLRRRCLRSIAELDYPAELVDVVVVADRWLSISAAQVGRASSREERYRREARLRAQEHCDYRFARACRSCDAHEICDGFQGDYARLLGMDDARPLQLGGEVDSPLYFVKQQKKTLHPDDAAWAATT